MTRRQHAVVTLQRHLVRRGFPRFEMLVIVVATGLAGFGTSVALLLAGVSSMPLRYLLSVLLAYAIFLLLVRLWVEYQRRRLEPDGDGLDVLPDLVPSGGGRRRRSRGAAAAEDSAVAGPGVPGTAPHRRQAEAGRRASTSMSTSTTPGSSSSRSSFSSVGC